MDISVKFSQLERTNIREELQTKEFDVLIIGGGITGAGIALDAVLRGLKVALIEKQDFGAGTSSRSTKLVHGGLRYLENLEFKLVHEVGKERETVHKNAPHLVIPTKMLLPIVKNGSLGKFTTSIGLLVYDFLAGVKKSEKRIMLSKKQTLNREPIINPDILKGGALYYEYKTDDARLVIETLKKANSLGAVAASYCPFKEFLYKDEKVCGVKAYDLLDSKAFEIKAKVVINATGPWVDRIRTNDGEIKGKRLHITKGIHIVVDKKKLPINNAIYFDVEDGRMIFAIPKKNKVYIGTTDTDYTGNYENPEITKDDVSYLLSAANKLFPSITLDISDIESSWSGLRPLIHTDGKSPSEMSRKDEIFYSTTGLISIAGGKLTGYRKMAERIVDIVLKKLSKSDGYKYVKCTTENVPLSGADFKFYPEIFKIVDYADSKFDEIKQTGISKATFQNMFYRYGTNIDAIINQAFTFYNQDKDAELAFLKAEVWYSINHEMTSNLVDFFLRRTEMLFFESQKVEQIAQIVFNEFISYFSWNKEILKKQYDELHVELKRIKQFTS
jgi:glycerol-3-phosphate dehydrogenase